jgi:arylsulfatase A-like enzyme
MRPSPGLLLLLAVVVGSAAGGADPAAAQGDPPSRPRNIVVVLTDDQRFDSLWAMPILQDRLRSRGVTFTNAIVTTPLCCPFRAAFLSGGYYSHNTGVHTNDGPDGGFANFDDANSLATRLQQAGYATLFAGKYMNGYDNTTPYVPPGWTRWAAFADGDTFTVRLHEGSTTTQPGTATLTGPWPQHDTQVYLDRMLGFLAQTAGSSRFVYLAPRSPHYPAVPEPQDADLFPDFVYRGRAWAEADISDKPLYVHNQYSPFWTRFPTLEDWDEYNRDQLRSLQSVDRAIGAIVDWIEAAGELSETVFVFTSDNGFLWGEHGMHLKSFPYEESIRVPLVVVVPGAAAREDDSLVSVDIDVPAMLLELAGLPATGDGVSLLPRVLDPAAPPREEALIEQYGQDWAGLRTQRASEDRMWKYVWLGRGQKDIPGYPSVELYDLTNDPYELENLYDDPTLQPRIAQMHQRMTELMGPHLDEQQGQPLAFFGRPYSNQLEVVGGTPPYRFEIVSGVLPEGLVLDPDTGRIQGVPTEVAVATITVRLSSSDLARQSGGFQGHQRPLRIVVREGDVDLDGVLDGADNCPFAYNPDQADSDGDGHGDVCDPECNDAVDNDGDGLVDLADPGCALPEDPSERGDAYTCDDGLDNDGDGLVDHGADPGCGFPYSDRENPACSDGLDNAGDGAVDAADPQCASPSGPAESAPGSSCGLGAELAGLLLLLRGAARRAGRGDRSAAR